MGKICFKCGLMKPLDDYYVHKQMGDGHLNKCKVCTKKDVKGRDDLLKSNPEYIEKERLRGREKHHRLYSKGENIDRLDESFKIRPRSRDEILEINRESQKRYRDRYPEKHKANTVAQRVLAKVKGNHMHHWSYNKQHYKDLIELSPQEHMRLHRHIQYDQERMMYRRCDNGELLDTKERHIEFYESLKNKP